MKKNLQNKIIVVLVLTLSLLINSSFASDSTKSSPKEILDSVIQQSRTDCEADEIYMTIVDEHNKEWNRKGLFYTKKKDEQNDMTLFYFTSPPELANSGVLTIENSSGLHDQWMYVPAYHAVRRIAGGNRGEKYIGTDFFYEDIIDIRVDEYDIKIFKREEVDTTDLLVFEVVPKSERLIKESAYSKTLWWIDPVKKVSPRIEYYDKEGKLLKILENSNLQLFKGYYLWGKQVMSDVQNKHKTIIEYKNREIDGSVPSDIFSVRYLRRKK